MMETQQTMGRPQTIEAIWLEIRSHLEEKQVQVQAEIVNYPPPIPACDVQFNHLLAQRGQISQALGQARTAVENPTNDSDSVSELRQFLDSTACLDKSLKSIWARQCAQFEK